MPRCAPRSTARFNALIVDGCTSTNDTVVAAGERQGRRADAAELTATLADACADLAQQLAEDSEGATRVAEIRVLGAAERRRRAARGPRRRRQPARQGLAVRRRPVLGPDLLRARRLGGGVRPGPGARRLRRDDGRRGRRRRRRTTGTRPWRTSRADRRRDLLRPRPRRRHGSGVDDRSRPRLHRREHGDVMSATPDRAAATTASTLAEAIPYIRRFSGAVIVVKFGGSTLGGRPRRAVGPRPVREDVVLMRSVGMLPVVVHGGGPQIGALMERLGKTPEFRDGQRVTDAETLEIARMVLVGKVNREIVGALNVHAPVAVGLSGEDGGFITAVERDPSLGFVGDVESVDPVLLRHLLAEGLVPVVATIAPDASGQAYNINADAVAGRHRRIARPRAASSSSPT